MASPEWFGERWRGLAPHFPPGPLPLPQKRKGARGIADEKERWHPSRNGCTGAVRSQ